MLVCLSPLPECQINRCRFLINVLMLDIDIKKGKRLRLQNLWFCSLPLSSFLRVAIPIGVFFYDRHQHDRLKPVNRATSSIGRAHA